MLTQKLWQTESHPARLMDQIVMPVDAWFLGAHQAAKKGGTSEVRPSSETGGILPT